MTRFPPLRSLVAVPAISVLALLLTATQPWPALGAEPPAANPALPAALPAWAELFLEQGPQWASPTLHAPVDLRYIPSGFGALVIVRPAALWNHVEGHKLRTAEPLATEIAEIDRQLKAAAGVQLADVEQLIVSVASDPQLGYQTALVVELKTALDPAELRKRWGDPSPWKHGAASLWADHDRLFFIPAEGAGKRFAVALGVSDKQAFADQLSGQQPGLWRRELESLLKGADANRHLTVVFGPTFLLGQGKHLFSGSASLASVLTEFRSLAVADDRSRELIKGVLLSLHAGDDYFHLECRVEGGNSAPPAVLARTLYTRLSSLPERVRAEFERDAPSLARTGGRAVLARYPLMLNALAAYLRSGAEGRQVVLTSVAPAEAAHNLALGTSWALAPRASVTTPTQPRALTFAERLAQRVDFKSPSDSLDRMVDQIQKDFSLPIHIEGRDLQTFGITKGKRFGINLTQAPLADVLTELARQANPALLAKVNHADQHLVWVIDDSRGPGQERVVFTTRDRVKDRGKLAPAFVLTP